LAIARTIKRLGIKFRSNVELVAFAGEEQGLLGSHHYARTSVVLRVFRIATHMIFSIEEMREADRDLTLMIQADMIAYHEPGEPQQLGLPKMYVSPSCVARVPQYSRRL
jgi:Zn-dependent M28 family amino/carboxypeptidase